MLTARDDTSDKVRGLALLARVEVILHRLAMLAPKSRALSLRAAKPEVNFAEQGARLRHTQAEDPDRPRSA